MKPFDAYEIHGCQQIDASGNPDPNGTYIETCHDEEAMFWTLYGHIPGEGVQAIGDFTSREAAEEVYCRIAGERVNRDLLISEKEKRTMNKQTYKITAWCSMPHQATFDVQAASPEAALASARDQVREEPVERCDGFEEWDEFTVRGPGGQELLTHFAPGFRLQNAAVELVEAIDAIRINAEGEGLSLYECLVRYGIHGLRDELDACEAALQAARLPTMEAA
jgi:hypothetical protein